MSMSLISYTEPLQRLRRRPGFLRWAEYVLLIAGFGCLGVYLGSLAQTWSYQTYEGYLLEERLQGREGTFSGFARYLAAGSWLRHADVLNLPSRPSVRKTVPAAIVGPGGVIGRIEIPRINVSAIVRQGTDGKTLARAAGHVPETALPGAQGNVGIAAHRDTFFRGVRNIRKGDLIRVITPAATFEYAVDTMRIVWPANVEVLDPTPKPTLTLVTCYPFNFIGSAPKRYIVTARQIAGMANEAASD